MRMAPGKGEKQSPPTEKSVLLPGPKGAHAAAPSARDADTWGLRHNLESLVAPSPLGELDGMRALAVLWVIALHCCQFAGLELARDGTWRAGEAREILWDSWLMQLALAGDMGVDVFFVLSG